MSLGQKSLWIFVPGLKIDKRREQKQHYALLRSQQLLRAKALRVEGPSVVENHEERSDSMMNNTYLVSKNYRTPGRYHATSTRSSLCFMTIFGNSFLLLRNTICKVNRC